MKVRIFSAVALLSLLLPFSLFSQTPVWSEFPSSPSGTSPRNDDVHFVDPLHGWVARATDGIYRTTNGGNTFEKVRASSFGYPGTNLTAHFRSIGFASTTRGWAGNLAPGSYDATVTDTNMLFETSDAGTSWTPVEQVNNSGMKGFCALHVMDPQHIYGVGRVRGPAYFAKSEDGGANWWVTNLTTGGVMGGLMDVYFKDVNNGFIVGMDTNAYNACTPPYYHGAIARTTNGGLSWQVVASTTVNCSYFWKMSWPSANIGYASLQQNVNAGTIIFYKTTDGGATWSSNGIPHASIGVSSGTSWFLQSIGFHNDLEGWMGGSTSTSLTLNQCFIQTTDGGATWSPVGYSNTRGMNRIRFLSPTLGYGSGQRVHVFRIPLAITANPTNQSVAPGAPANFSVTAFGTAPLAYQWRRFGTNLIGATASSLAIPAAGAGDVGPYDVIATDYSGSVTSGVATLSFSGSPLPPTIVTQPQSRFVNPAESVTFNVGATGTAPLSYHWKFNSVDIPNATNAALVIASAQITNAGRYAARVTNSAGFADSVEAFLTVAYSENFDAFAPPSPVTNFGTTNGFKIVFRAATTNVDFKAIFGFDYSTVTFPTTIPSAPSSTGGSTRGLFLTVNKDASGAAAAVNLYPTNRFFAENFSLKFDLWINWRDIDTSTEHALFGIHHSGNVTNRIGQSPSDGLFFGVEGEDDSLPTSMTLRDYSVFRGGGTGAPVLMTTNNTVFGVAPLLGPEFENYNAGFVSLFPSQTFPVFGSTPPGTAGLRWLRGEVRQFNQRITWLLNDTIIAQYTNTYAYTNGNILIGYLDNFTSIGDSNNFAIFDNVRVEPVAPPVVTLGAPPISAGQLQFGFATTPYESYTVQWATNIAAPLWVDHTNILGNGAFTNLSLPWAASPAEKFIRVRQP
jgi:photosystem II stability/assembly factor-like uncharacterized protein